MTFRTHLIIQFALMVLQGAVAKHLLPEMAHEWAALVLSAAQLVLAAAAHQRNPDGTPAQVAWEPEKK